MNQMLDAFWKGSNEISQERLDEIFAIQKTEKIWNEIESNKNFNKIFGKIAVERFFRYSGRTAKLEDYQQKVVENEKRQIVFKAMFICAQNGISFNRAVQESAKNYLKQLKKITAKEIEEILEEREERCRVNVGYEKLIKAIFPTEYK